jgi:hypothetical protein
VVRSIKYDEGAKGLLVLLLIIQLLLTNGIYLAFGAICFGIIFYYLQQPFKPSVFTLIFIYHFLQISAAIWLSNYLGKEINYRSPSSGIAILLSYVGLFFLFVPVIYYQNKIPAISISRLKEHAAALSTEKCFKAYLISFFIINSIIASAFLFSGLTQIVFSLVKIKWMFYLLFGLQVVLKRKMVKQFVLLSLIEFLFGFYSYFSEYKTVVLFLAALFLILLIKITLRPLVLSLLICFGAFYVGAFYQGIKGEYRQFLNDGGTTQEVLVSKEDALGKLVELTQNQDDEGFSSSVELFLDRLQYTYHLARAMDYVPAKLPYQDGLNWGTSLEFSLTPRILNPDKPYYEASAKTTKFTGIGYARASQGVSVSLGYFADGYVDFGYLGMFFPLLVVGLIYGSTYYYFVRKSSNNYLFNFAVVSAMYMEFIAFEMDSTFLIGRLFATLLTFFMLKIFFFPWLYKQLIVPEPAVVKTEASKPTFSSPLKSY